MNKVLNANIWHMKNGSYIAWCGGFCWVFQTVTDDFGSIFIVSFVAYNGGLSC